MLSEKIETRLAARTKWPLLKRSVVRARLIWRRGPDIAAEVSPELPAKRPPLVRGHLLLLLPQVMTLLRRQGVEPAARIADGFPLLGRQLAETLKPFAQLLLLVGRQLAPLLEPLPRLITFLLIHVRPLSRTVMQPFLPFGRQLVPGLVELLEHLLFILAQLMPRHSRRIRLRQRGSSKSEDHHQANHNDHHGFTSLRGTITSVPFRLDSWVVSAGRFCVWPPASGRRDEESCSPVSRAGTSPT